MLWRICNRDSDVLEIWYKELRKCIGHYLYNEKREIVIKGGIDLNDKVRNI